MQEQQKRKVMGGYGDDGIPLWMNHALRKYDLDYRAVDRIRRRLSRMLKVISAKEDRLSDLNVEIVQGVIKRATQKYALAKMNTCPTHGQTPNAWGCPECVRVQRTEIQTLTRERNHWKANHDHQVQVNRLLRDRPDLGERARLAAHLMKENDEMRARLQPGADVSSKEPQTNLSDFKAAFARWEASSNKGVDEVEDSFAAMKRAVERLEQQTGTPGARLEIKAMARDLGRDDNGWTVEFMNFSGRCFSTLEEVVLQPAAEEIANRINSFNLAPKGSGETPQPSARALHSCYKTGEMQMGSEKDCRYCAPKGTPIPSSAREDRTFGGSEEAARTAFKEDFPKGGSEEEYTAYYSGFLRNWAPSAPGET